MQQPSRGLITSQLSKLGRQNENCSHYLSLICQQQRFPYGFIHLRIHQNIKYLFNRCGGDSSVLGRTKETNVPFSWERGRSVKWTVLKSYLVIAGVPSLTHLWLRVRAQPREKDSLSCDVHSQPQSPHCGGHWFSPTCIVLSVVKESTHLHFGYLIVLG